MVDIITYSLRDGRKRSDHYYQVIAVFTDEVLQEAGRQLRGIVVDFQNYLAETDRETPRSQPEYAFELLTLGIIWRIYGRDALALVDSARRILDRLVRLRQDHKFWKPAIDLLRGVLGNIFLFSKNRLPGKEPPPTLENLDRLLNWMAASGEFKEEVKRLRAWQEFLESKSGREASAILGTGLSFASWFEVRSLNQLGRYTPNVEKFLADTHPGYRWREDELFCGRQRVEYHMNMVGSEIMNRAFRESFLETKRKVVLLPPCMKAKPEGECEAVMTPFGERCAACTPGCRVHQTTKLGQKRGFDVFVLPHELSVFSSGEVKPKRNGSVGIVGVSCPLTNVTGGWETRDLGIPAQGILLDYCGCSWHWHLDRGIPTDINFGRLQQVVGVGQQQETSS